MNLLIRNLISYLLGLDKHLKSLIVIIFDSLVIFGCWCLFFVLPGALITQFQFNLFEYIFQDYFQIYLFPLLGFLASMFMLNGYREIFRSFSLGNIYPLFVSSLVFFVAMVFTTLSQSEDLSIFPVLLQAFSITATSFTLLIISRIVFRFLSSISKDKVKKRIFIFGAGNAAKELFGSLSYDNKFDVKHFVSANKNLIGRELFSKTIISLKEAEKIWKKDNKFQLYIASRSLKDEEREKIINVCANYGVKVKKIASYSEMLREKEVSLTDLTISDLLPRKNLDEFSAETNELKDKTILITGAGGSIGSEISRIITQINAKKAILLDISESALFAISQELKEFSSETIIVPVLASVKNKQKLREVFTKYNPDIVYHAAAYKHVPILEDENNYQQSMTNNFFGTVNIAEVCLEKSVKKCIFVSTDKAVRPTNIMGASKRLAEIFLDSCNASKKTIFSSVRFGNVIDSSGSVIPIFRNQIKRGGPLTVTHPDIIRYFMTIGEAAYLVILSSIISKEPNVYMLKMGDPVKILDIAKKMIKLSGNEIKSDKNKDGIEIIFTGLRPGEKLYEELLVDSNDVETDHPKIFMDTNRKNYSFDEIKLMRDNILKSIEENDKDALIEIITKYADYMPELNTGQGK